MSLVAGRFDPSLLPDLRLGIRRLAAVAGSRATEAVYLGIHPRCDGPAHSPRRRNSPRPLNGQDQKRSTMKTILLAAAIGALATIPVLAEACVNRLGEFGDWP